MTVQATTPLHTYLPNGGTKYPYFFRIFNTSDLIVKLDGVTLVENTDYVVTETSVSTGFIVTTTAYTTGTLTLSRSIPLAQDTDWVNASSLDLSNVEADLDKMVLVAQQQDVIVTDTANFASVAQGDWVTATAYVLKQFVTGPDGKLYQCLSSHTSTVFTTDLASGYWKLFIRDEPTSTFWKLRNTVTVKNDTEIDVPTGSSTPTYAQAETIIEYDYTPLKVGDRLIFSAECTIYGQSILGPDSVVGIYWSDETFMPITAVRMDSPNDGPRPVKLYAIRTVVDLDQVTVKLGVSTSYSTSKPTINENQELGVMYSKLTIEEYEL